MTKYLEWFKKNYTLKPLPEKRGKYVLEIDSNSQKYEVELEIKLPYGYVIDLEDGKISTVVDNTSFGGPPDWARSLNRSDISIIISRKEIDYLKKELTDIIMDAYDPMYAWKTED